MSSSTLRLVFQTVLAGSGFAKLDAQTSAMQKRLGKVAQGAQVMGQAFGSAGKVVGRSLGMLLTGGIWGAAAAVAVKAVESITSAVRKHREEVKALDREVERVKRGYAKGFDTTEFREAAYARRLGSYAQEDADAKKAAEDAAKAREAAAKRESESRKAMGRLELEYYGLEESIALERMKSGLESGKENERLKARLALVLATAKASVSARERELAVKEREWKRGDGKGEDVDLARKRLELAKAEAETAKASVKAEVEAFRERKRQEREEAERREEMAAAEFEEERRKAALREKGEAKAAEIRKKAGEDAEAVEAKIAEAKKRGEAWEARAEAARGQSFGDWQRGERDRERQERGDERRRKGRLASVDREIGRLARTNPKLRTEGQSKRLKDLVEWRRMQDAKNNPANGEVADLERERQLIAERSEKHLEAISKAMKDMGL